jgi:predicted Zn-dependent protease
MRAAALAFALLLAFVLACQTSVNPATGRREVLLMSAEEEREAQEIAEEQISQQFGLVQDEALAAYVQELGEGLASESPRQDVEYRFYVLEMDEPNAFALPAGAIFVSRGLLLLLNSEAELANVLAHEIAHVAARHAAQRHAHQSTFGLATLLSNVSSGTEESTGSRRESIGGAYGIIAYARNQEREADHIGQDLVVRAGVDPTAMTHVLRALQTERRRSEGYAPENSYFQTHPTSLERIAENSTRAQLLRWQPGFAIAADPADFLSRLEGMTVQRPASEGVIDGNHFLHPVMDFSLRFPPDWAIENANAYVMARPPGGDQVVLLALDSEGDDPAVAARAYADREGLRLSDVEGVKIGSLDAVRGKASVETPAGRVEAELTWIAYNGLIFRLIAGRSSGRLRRAEGISRAIARTFRPLTAEERASITELRLRLVIAREGETLEEVGNRSGNQWDLHRIASVNGVLVGTKLAKGRLVKVAVREAWRPAPPSADETPEADSLP